MLRIEHLTKKYGDKKAVDDLSLHIQKGEIYGFIGHNGAGKTTTIKSCCGILNFDEGEIYVDGVSVKEKPLECKRKIAYIPDNPDLYEFMTGIKYLSFIADIFEISQSDRQARISKYAEMFEIKNALAQTIDGYSHGMKQKLAIVSALIHNPNLIIMDEPFVGLDPKSSHLLKTLMREMCDNGGAIFFSTHVLEVAEKLCDKVAIIKSGKLIKSGTMDEVKGDDSLTVEELIRMTMRTGENALEVMKKLDEANTETYGNPSPHKVDVHIKKGPFIIVSGHDLKDLEMLLEQSKGKGINVYTHGEMLPCHGYDGLKKYPHLIGNFGGAWQDQQKQFDNIPGCILMTTNCLMRPRDSYKDRIYSTNVVGWEGVKHIGKKENGDKDFSEIIQQAIELGGFKEDVEPHEILVGFGHYATLSYADKIVEAVKSGKVRHFFLIGGCDGARPGRNYYTEFAENVPKDCIIMTLACGKYRFNKLEFGDIDGLPRLLDIGQCNDVYSAICIAVALADAFDTDVNGLPLSLIVSWYEQKAVADLLALLSLGIKNIYLGPTLPAFLSPNVLQYLSETFGLRPISNAEDDLKTCLKQNV